MARAINDYSEVLQPVATARGLPNDHYTSQEVFEAERAALWFSTWAGIGVAAEIPEPGDARPIDYLGVPLFALRAKDGHIRVFQNVCRHRGMILVSEPRRIEGAIRCPYHSWCYSHQGDLVATPHVGGAGQNTHEAIDRATLGLIEVRSHIWRDVIFVNLSGDAPEFEDANGDLIARWAEFETPLYHGGDHGKITLTCKTNWKLAVENYAESYHLPWVHPGLNSYSRLEDHYNIVEPTYSGQGTHVYRQISGKAGVTLPDFPHLSDKWENAGEYITLTPNVLFGVQRDHAFAIVLEPKGPNRTVEHIHLYYAEPETDPGLRAENKSLWETVFVEDIGVVEGMQAGRAAPGFDGGRFSPAMDGPTHAFHSWVAARMAAHG